MKTKILVSALIAALAATLVLACGQVNAIEYEVTIYAIDDGTGWNVPTALYIDSEHVLDMEFGDGSWYATVYLEPGNHTIGMDDQVPTWIENLYWWFGYYDFGYGWENDDNPRTFAVSDDMTVIAHYQNGWG